MALTRRTRLVLFTVLSLVLLGVIVWLTGSEGAAGITIKLTTPGPLSNAHAPMDLDEQCSECHEQAGGFTGGLLTPDQKCRDCHVALDERIQAERGFHAKILENFEAEGDTCRRCHVEHLGKDVPVVVWTTAEEPFKPAGREDATQKDFPHELATGFALNGAHATIECEDCHKLSLVSDDPTSKVQETFQAEGEFTSFLGLSKTCADCHQDPHVPSQGADCAKCHSEAKWDDLPEFDHDETRFKLNGAHETVDCEKCHLATGADPPAPAAPAGLPNFEPIVAESKPRVFRGVGFGTVRGHEVSGEELPDCKACHENPHRDTEAFLDCQSCHNEAKFAPMDDAATFDHAPFYPLEGAHATEATCVGCHGEKEGERGPLLLPKRETCRECHQEDYDEYHAGSFDRELEVAFQADAEGCAQCHDVKTFKESTYRLEDHTPQAKPPVAIPLAASHEIRCEYCHGTGNAQLEPLVAVREGRKNFTKDRPFPRLPAQGRFSIGQLESDCETCHVDVHEGALTIPEKDQTCATCHWFDSWHGTKTEPLDRDGHAALGFPIRGKHDEIFDDCQACHGGKTPEGALREVALAEIKQNPAESCNVCHHEVGDAAHRGSLGKDCASCHNESEWDPAEYTFEEHQQTRFPLTDAHAAVPCQVCHEPQELPASEQPVAGQTISFHPHTFEADPLRCTTCHQEDSPHGRQFRRQDCDRCHTTQAYVPSTYDAQRHLTDARFPLEDAHDTTCTHCHQPPAGRPPKNAIYENTPRACALCHADHHLGQFFQKGREGCSVCHTIKDWEPSRFDHDKARFQLKGAHQAVACEACHPMISRTFDGETKQTAHYFPIDARACQDCHQNPHGGAK